MLLGTWRTNDAEKNHTHKIRKRKKEKKEKEKRKKKPHDGWDGMELENGMVFCVGRTRGIGRGNTRRKEGITIRYEGVGVGVGVARVNTINLTLPCVYLLHTCMHFPPFVGGLRSGCCSRLYMDSMYCATRALPPPRHDSRRLPK